MGKSRPFWKFEHAQVLEFAKRSRVIRLGVRHQERVRRVCSKHQYNRMELLRNVLYLLLVVEGRCYARQNESQLVN